MSARVAVLGGDAREAVVAELLHELGCDVATFGLATADPEHRATTGLVQALEATAPADAVAGRQWVICPSPGLGDGDLVYAPFATDPIALDAMLLATTRIEEGGVVLGRGSSTLRDVVQKLDSRLFEMKDDMNLKAGLANSTAEALVALIIRETARVLAEQSVLVLGYGATGAALADRLMSLGSSVTIAARNAEARARAGEAGAAAIAFEHRSEAMLGATVVVNTVPSISSLPLDALRELGGTLVIDIASPPGGTDHEVVEREKLAVRWPRGLAGTRAPRTAGEMQYQFIVNTMRSVAAPQLDTASPIT